MERIKAFQNELKTNDSDTHLINLYVDNGLKMN